MNINDMPSNPARGVFTAVFLPCTIYGWRLAFGWLSTEALGFGETSQHQFNGTFCLRHHNVSTLKTVIFAQRADLCRLSVGVAKGESTKGGQDTEQDGDGLAEADSAGNGRATQDDGGEKAQLNTVGLAVLDAVATEAVCQGIR